MKSILFNQEMVRALLDGRKSVTRRVVKQKGWEITGRPEWGKDQRPGGRLWFTVANNNTATAILIEPPYHPGEILYVRERFAHIFGRYVYRADYQEVTEESKVFWRPSIHMPKEAARIFLRVTEVKAERLQEITEEQAEAEWCRKWYEGAKLEETARDDFCDLWDSTVKKADLPRYGWDASPWVWVIAFERISKEEAMRDEN